MKIRFIVFLSLFLISICSFAQKNKNKNKSNTSQLDSDDKEIDEKIQPYEKLKTDSLPELALGDEIIDERNPLGLKKKRSSVDKKEGKKKYYYNIRIKKGYADKNAESVEIFRYTKFEVEPEDPFAQEVYFYDFETRSVQNKPYSVYKELLKKGYYLRLLHGAYQERAGKSLLAEGFYYLGTKHGRWMTYDANYILTEKLVYDKGYVEDTQINYHSNGKVKEVIPIVHGEKHGTYYAFHENGELLTKGKYEYNEQVGDWYDYYPNGKKKRQTRYKKLFHLKDKPFVVYEWDNMGNLTYDAKRNKK